MNNTLRYIMSYLAFNNGIQYGIISWMIIITLFVMLLLLFKLNNKGKDTTIYKITKNYENPYSIGIADKRQVNKPKVKEDEFNTEYDKYLNRRRDYNKRHIPDGMISRECNIINWLQEPENREFNIHTCPFILKDNQTCNMKSRIR